MRTCLSGPTDTTILGVATARSVALLTATLLCSVFVLSLPVGAANPDAAVTTTTVVERSNWGVRGLSNAEFSVTKRVADLATADGKVFAVGRFTTVVGPDRSERAQPHIAAFDATSGSWISGFRPIVNGPIHTIEPSPDGRYLYLGGEFSQINGVATGPIAKITTNGTVDQAFNPSFGPTNQGQRYILNITADSDGVFVGGAYATVNGSPRRSLARLDAASGALDQSFGPDVAGGSVLAIETLTSGDIAIGGQFREVDGDDAHAFFAVINRSGRLLPQPTFDGRLLAEPPTVYALAETSDLIFAASRSNTLNLIDPQTLVRTRTYGPDVANSGQAGWFRSSDFQALNVINGSVYAGNHTRWLGQPSSTVGNGHRDSLTGLTTPVNLLSKYEPDGDQVRSYLPPTLDGGVWAIEPAGGSCIWVAGNLRINGLEDWNLGQVCEIAPFGPFLTTEAFVQQQYLDFLGRSGDRTGTDYWVRQSKDQTANAAPIIEWFLSSPEFEVRREITRLYLGILDRLPDDDGLDYWSQRRGAGVPLTTMASGFLASPEFASLVGIVDNRQFAAQIYQNVLERQPDRAGLDYWEGRLNSGLSRASLVVSFTESPEFVAKTDAVVTVTTIYSGMLDRRPDPDGLAFWVNRLDQGGSVAPLISGFFSSEEYRARVAGLG